MDSRYMQELMVPWHWKFIPYTSQNRLLQPPHESPHQLASHYPINSLNREVVEWRGGVEVGVQLRFKEQKSAIFFFSLLWGKKRPGEKRHTQARQHWHTWLHSLSFRQTAWYWHKWPRKILLCLSRGDGGMYFPRAPAARTVNKIMLLMCKRS